MERKFAKFQGQGFSRSKVKRKRKLWRRKQRKGQFCVQLCNATEQLWWHFYQPRNWIFSHNFTYTSVWNWALRWLRRNAQRSEQWYQNGEGASRRVPDTSVRGSRSYHAETKSKPACLHRRGAREKSGILNINSPIFFTPSQEQV